MPIPPARLEGITRSGIYELILHGQIRSKSLRKPGCTRGIRLVHIPSLRAYIENAGEESCPIAEVVASAAEEGGEA